MDKFLNWFYIFLTTMFGGVWEFLKAFYNGIINVFNIPQYITALINADLDIVGMILGILSLLIVYIFWGLVIFVIILSIRKSIKINKNTIGNDDLLEELSDLHRDVMRLTREKEKILALKVGQTTITREQLEEIFNSSKQDGENFNQVTEYNEDGTPKQPSGNGNGSNAPAIVSRFSRLILVDEKYKFYTAPEYDNNLSLSEICEDFRCFANVKMNLYYDLRTVRLLFAGLASTKLLLLQGISGTGKTSLPYALGKYLKNDATIVAVQPSWRDRSELFGFYNEFTKKFSETEVLRRIYDANYNDNVNIVVLDEMNIARVEYYFAEMLSLMEMPNPEEWNLEIVASSMENDPKLLTEGRLFVPQNMWFIGTANNDDSTFAVSDKVYDRAFTINLDSKGVKFDCDVVDAKQINYSYIEKLYKQAFEDHPVSQKTLNNISKLDLYIIEHFRVAFGNRILKQLNFFVPAYVACGGDEVDGVDYLLATKVIRKFDSLNLSLIRDEIKGLIYFMDTLFGKGVMKECTAYLLRLEKTY